VLGPIEDVLTVVLEWLHASAGLPWAWAIIALTIVVRVLILPLAVKQIRAAQKLQVHAPQLKALQQKYKHDRQRMNEEVMKFYRENKVNPAASCLPILFQLPIFFALFFVLRDFETEVFPEYQRQGETVADLGWLNIVPNITDAILADWSGWLLLVIYVGSQLASVISMPMTDPRQRYLFYSMPFLFAIFIVAFPTGSFPIGLMLYWVTTNLWAVGQGLITRRLMPRAQPPPKRSSRTPPREERESADGAARPVEPARGTQPGQQRVRRRKKKGPRSRR
jgi:YidC/Oxa1 family membrane protein insertase